jgi:protein-tyrosine kinase
MERIKQALDKARAERQSEPRAPVIDFQSQAPVLDVPFAYSSTKVQEINLETLRANRIVLGDTTKIGLSAYKMLRTQVMQRMSARGWNALAITSPAPEDGKTTTAINLAISLAREMHHTVLLVDMDLRNPSVHRYLGLRPERGITDYLLHSAQMSDVLVNPGIERLVVLPGTESVENSSEILASPAMGVLVQELKSRYPSRIVLFDLPPLLAADDALSFAPYVDAFLLVFRDGKTTKTEVERSMEILKDVPIVGTVLNASDERLSAYY